ncbi:MAG: hypothetical protein JO218_06815 [Burkholderiales bacterium]|nr:hypothetical protein [Burkholderiales bacterium]
MPPHPSATHRPHLNAYAGYIGLACLIALCIVLRQPDQWRHPVVWIEDGTQVLPDLLARGIASLADPVNGYLVVCSKLISWIALQFGLPNYAIASTVLTLIASTLCFTAIAFAPTRLRHARWCALAAALAPVGPETFVSPIYLLWHTGILLLLVLVWDPSRHTVWRGAVLVFAGLSSPLVAFLLPLLALRWLILRHRSDLACTAICLLVAACQIYLAHRMGDTGGATPDNLEYLPVLLATVCGQFLSFALPPTWAAICGGMLLAWLALPLLDQRIPRDDRTNYLSLVGILVLSVAAMLLRVGHTEALQFHGPNRYYFFALIALAWLVVQHASLKSRWFVAIPLLLAVLANSLHQYRLHNPAQDILPLKWSAPAQIVKATGQGSLPVFMLDRVVNLDVPLDVSLFKRGRSCAAHAAGARCVIHPWIIAHTDYPPAIPRRDGAIVSTSVQGQDLWARLDLGHNIGDRYREFHVVGKLAPLDMEVLPFAGDGGPLFELHATFGSADDAARFASSYCVAVVTDGKPALLASPNRECDALLTH